MLTDANRLMQAVHDLFTDLYNQKYGGGPFIAFEPLGLPISPGMFRLREGDTALSQALAVERLSEIANAVLTFADATAHHSERTVDSVVELMVDGASQAVLSAPFGAAKSQARQAFDATLGGLRNPAPFHPVLADPADWFDPAAAGIWTQRVLADPKPGAAPARVPQAIWHVLPDDLRGSLSEPLAAAYPDIQKFLGRVNLPPAVSIAAGLLGGLLGGAGADAGASELSPLLSALSTAALAARACRQAVATTDLRVAFDSCVVSLSRPWFARQLVLQRDWFIAGYARGAISNGSGMDDPGLMPTVATGFVAIRNLSLSGNWSEGDRQAMQSAASLGPFSLQGRTIGDDATITCPGMQIIGWFCDPLPVLPPEGDPALQDRQTADAHF